jgi:hypothetical protein
MASQVDGASQPTGETMPMPVTTILGLGRVIKLDVLIDLSSISLVYPTMHIIRSANALRMRPDFFERCPLS